MTAPILNTPLILSLGAGVAAAETVKYSSAGVPLWTNRYGEPGNGSEQSRGIAVDGNGNVFVTETATINYSAAAVLLWTNRYHGPAISLDQAPPLR